MPRRRNDGKGQRFPILYDILFTPDQLADGVQIYDKTALQTQAPVIDRMDSFRVNDFSTAPIASANTSYPIFREGELLGAVVFEQTAEIVDKGIKKLEATRHALSSFQNKPPTISFSGYTFANVIGGCPKLRSYHWPGNVRELFHVLDYAQNVTDSGSIEVCHLPPYLLKRRASPSAARAIDFTQRDLQGLMDDYEREIIVQALEHCGYNISQTAKTLGILRQSLQYRIRKYGLIF